MKKLTKTLSLVLVVAMVLGLCVIGAGATFTDNDKITKDYSEAVTIMTDLKVVGGYKDSSFKPTGTLTRAEACVILANMTLGTTAAAALAPTTATFKDIPASFWGYKFVEYCYQSGFIAGTGAGKFSPNSTLTGYQWALMLMKVLGYDMTSLTTGNWQINTAKTYYATNTKFSDVAISGAAVSREAATQMAYDALFYAPTNTTKVWGIVGSHTDAVTGAVINDYGWIPQAPSAASAIAHTVFGVTKTTTGKVDSFGRPATVYTVDAYKTATQNIKVATSYGWNGATQSKTFANVPVASYTTAVTANELYGKLGSTAVIKATGSAYATTTMTANTLFIGGTTSSSDVTVGTNKAVLGGAGIITEIYATATANQFIAVQIRPTLAKVTNVTTTAATPTTGAFTTYQINGGSYNVYTSKVSGAEVTQATITDTVAKNDWVMIYGASANEVYVAPAKVVSGKLTGFTSSTNSYTIGGTSYVKSAAVAGSGVTATFTAYNADATYALDTYGNVVGSVTVTVPSNYVFVLSAASSQYLNTTTNKVTTVIEATVITTDGKLQTIKTTATDPKDLDTASGHVDTLNSGSTSAIGLYTYTVNTDGLYTLTLDSAAQVPAIVAGKALTQVKKDDATIGSGVYATTATKYYVAQKDTKGVYTGVTTYTGFNNMPSMTLPTNCIALDADGNGVAEVVFLDATTESGASASYVYVTGSFTTDGTTYTYDVIANGQTSTMKLASGSPTGLCTVTNGVASLVAFPQSGSPAANVDKAVALSAGSGVDGIYGVATKYFSFNNGLLMASADNTTYTYLATIAATTPVYTFANGACTASTADGLSATTGSMIVFAVNAAGTAIQAVYVVK